MRPSGSSSGGPSVSCCLVHLIALFHLDVTSADSRVVDINGWGLFRKAVAASLLAFPALSSSLTSFSPGLNPIANFRGSLVSRSLGAFEFMLSALALSQGILRGGL